MTDSITVDSLAHDYLSDDDKLTDFLKAFDQDEFDHLANALMQYCIRDYSSLPSAAQYVVFKMAEVMAMKELDVPFDISDIVPF